MSAFARTIMEGKNYAHYLSQQKRHETWPEVAERVSRCVVEPYLGADFTRRIRQLIEEKKFMPGGATCTPLAEPTRRSTHASSSVPMTPEKAGRISGTSVVTR
jgi:hypothetical protein